MTLTGTIPVPFGWFRVADSADLAPGGLASVRVCERDLVVWRTVDGTASCVDAWCPHLGAHLGVGGRVDGASIVCPFHGWEFGPDGANCRIPSSERINGRARLRTHPVIERNGLVLAWVHPLGDPPTFDVPEFPETADPDYLPFIIRSYVINTSVQELGENGIDRCHFPVVHLADEPPVIAEYDGSGDIAHVRTIVELKTPFGDFPGEIDVHQYGPGISATRFIGFVDTLLIATQTPIERDRCELRFHFTVRRTGTEAEAREIAELYVGHIDEQAREDVPIWEHKAFVPRPALSDVDGPILEYRRWAARFQVAPAG